MSERVCRGQCTARHSAVACPFKMCGTCCPGPCARHKKKTPVAAVSSKLTEVAAAAAVFAVKQSDKLSCSKAGGENCTKKKSTKKSPRRDADYEAVAKHPASKKRRLCDRVRPEETTNNHEVENVVVVGTNNNGTVLSPAGGVTPPSDGDSDPAAPSANKAAVSATTSTKKRQKQKKKKEKKERKKAKGIGTKRLRPDDEGDASVPEPPTTPPKADVTAIAAAAASNGSGEAKSQVIAAPPRKKKKKNKKSNKKKEESQELAFETNSDKGRKEAAAAPDKKVATKLGEWLNDKVINVFMKMINVRSAENIDDSENTDDAGGTAKKKKKKKKKKKTKKRSGGKEKEILNVHAFSTFFYNKLKGHGIDGVKRWTKKVKLFQKEMLLIPLHINGTHWVLVAVNLKDKTFGYYDSLGGSGGSYISAIKTYLHEEAKLRGVKWDKSEWKSNPRVSPLPQQLNLYDCGVFLCRFADRLSRSCQLNFKPGTMKKQHRQFILDKIRKGRL
eukprot:gene1597-28505_t